MKKLNDWFEIDEQEYLMYLLKGYDIYANELRVEWVLNNETHREDGPAFIHTDGYQAWYLNGQFHKIDGPAIIWSDGDKEWWLNGKHYTEAKFNEAIKQLV